jgi:WD40 repeat protein
METEIPVQSPDAQPRKSRWSARRVCVMLFLLFAAIFAVSWWLTPIQPYATLILNGACGRLLYSPDGTMLVTRGKEDFGRSAGPLRVWEVASGQERFSLGDNWKAIETVHFSPNSGLLAAHEMEGELKIWNTKTGDEIAHFSPETKFTNWVNFQFSPDGRFLVFQDHSKGWANNKNFITFWNIESKQEQGSVENYSHTLVFARDGKSFATCSPNESNNTEVLLWKFDQIPVCVKRDPVTASQIAFSPDLQTLATADDLPDGNGQVAMWDMMTGEKRWSANFNEHDTHLQSLFFSAGGKILTALGGGGTQMNWRFRWTLWDVTSSPKEIGSFLETPTVSPDGQWLAIPLESGSKLIKISQPERGTDLIANGDLGPSAFVIFNNMKWLPTASFSPDSKMILVGGLDRHAQEPFLGGWLPAFINPFHADPGGAIVRVWDVESRREILGFSKCTDAQFSPDGQVLATIRDQSVIDLWKVPFRASLWQAFGWAMIVWMIAVSICWLGVKAKKKRLRKPAADRVGS